MKKRNKYLLIISILIISIFLGIYCYFYFIQEQKIPILGYHNIVPDENYKEKANTFAIRLSTFKKQMNYLKKQKWKTLSMEEFECWKKKKCQFPRKSIVITFDDGYASVYKYILPILKENDQKATVFPIYKKTTYNHKTASDFSYLTQNLIQKSKQEYSNIEYHSHSYKMHHNKIYTYEEYISDMEKVKEIDKNIKYYAYPLGKYNNDYIKALKDSGYHLAFTFGPYANASRKDYDYTIPRIGMSEDLPDWKWKLKLALRY